MPGDLLTKYGSNGQSITITLNSLADGSTATSNEVSNTTNLFEEVFVAVTVLTESSGISASGVIIVSAIGSVDGGSSYPDSANIETFPIGIFNANVLSTTYISNPFSLRNVFRGGIPEKWKLIVRNETGNALESTGNSAEYQGVYGQYT